MANGVMREKSIEFAKAIIRITKNIRESYRENVLTNQLLRSGTSIGANIHEAHYAQSNDDFISKMEIALKECYESEYWLELLFETDYLLKEEYEKLKAACGALRRMLISSCTTAKNNRSIK